MKSFETLIEIGVEQAVADYVGNLLRVYLTAGSDHALRAGLDQAHQRYKQAQTLIAQGEHYASHSD
jgi:hypothetical protein